METGLGAPGFTRAQQGLLSLLRWQPGACNARPQQGLASTAQGQPWLYLVKQKMYTCHDHPLENWDLSPIHGKRGTGDLAGVLLQERRRPTRGPAVCQPPSRTPSSLIASHPPCSLQSSARGSLLPQGLHMGSSLCWDVLSLKELHSSLPHYLQVFEQMSPSQ